MVQLIQQTGDVHFWNGNLLYVQLSSASQRTHWAEQIHVESKTAHFIIMSILQFTPVILTAVGVVLGASLMAVP